MTNSCLMWGPNCVGEQGLCKLVARRTLGINNLTIDEYKSSNVDQVDLRRITSFMNTLDHQVKPRELFELALQKSDYVLIEIHSGGSIEKQHAFVLDETLLGDRRLVTVLDSKGKELVVADAQKNACYEKSSADLLMVFRGERT